MNTEESNWETFTPPKHQKKLQLRFASDELYEHMVHLAEQDHRSLNGEIMQAIREFVARRLTQKD